MAWWLNGRDSVVSTSTKLISAKLMIPKYKNFSLSEVF